MNWFFQGYHIAKRSAVRNTGRSAAIVTLIAGCTIITIGSNTLARAVFDFWVQTIVESGVAEVELAPPGSSNARTRHPISNISEVESWISQEPDIMRYSKRIGFSGLISYANQALHFVGMGFNPQQEKLVSPRLFSFKLNGNDFLTSDPNSVILGAALAKNLGVSPGEYVQLQAYSFKNRMNALPSKVSGVIEFPDERISRRLVYSSFDLAAGLMESDGNPSELALILHNKKLIEPWVKKSVPALTDLGLRAKPWWEVLPQVQKIGEIWKGFIASVNICMNILGFLAIIFLMKITVLSRRKELGLLTSLGLGQGGAISLFVWEFSLLVAIGTSIGIAIGSTMVWIEGQFGIPIPNPFFPQSVLIFPKISATEIYLSIAIGLVTSLTGAIIPLIYARSTNTNNMLRGTN